MSKTKIFVVYIGYLPAKNFGGPVISIGNLIEQCSDEFDFYVITYNHDHKDNTPFDIEHGVFVKYGNANVMYLAEDEFTSDKLVAAATEIKPDLIYHNGLYNYKQLICSINSSKKLNIPLIIAPRGELNDNAYKHKIYKKFFYIKALKLSGALKHCFFHSTSDDEKKSIIKRLSPKEENIHTIFNLPTVPKDYYTRNHTKQKNKNELRIVFISRIHPIKNLKFCFEALNDVKTEGVITFDIYGPKENEEYYNECMQQATLFPDQISVKYCGALKHDDIPEVLKKYQLFFLPTLNENYGHAIVEAMLADCPVLISDNTPWTSINDYQAGRAISLANKDDFVRVIEDFTSMEPDKYNNVIENLRNYAEAELKLVQTKEKYTGMFHQRAL